MQNLKQSIDATRFDIRVMWHGPREDNIPHDASLVEGWPLDPPDEFPGWTLVAFEVHATKDGERYCCLWAREKSRSRRAKRKPREKKPEQQELTGQQAPSFVVPKETPAANPAPPAAATAAAPPTPRPRPIKKKRAKKKRSKAKTSPANGTNARAAAETQRIIEQTAEAVNVGLEEN